VNKLLCAGFLALLASVASAGALFNGTCYPDAQTAKAELCGGYFSVWGSGADSLSVECVASDFTAATFTACRRTNGGSCSDTTATYPAFPSCSHSGGAGLAGDYFAALLALLVIVWLAAQIKRRFWGNDVSL
jgi:hypothetical protein